MSSDEYKIYRYLDRDNFDTTVPPLRLNFKTGLDSKLFMIESEARGRVTEKNWYAAWQHDELGNVIGSDLIIKEDFVHHDDDDGLLLYIDHSISWYREDGTKGESKNMQIPFNRLQARQEGRRRRQRVADTLSMKVIHLYALHGGVSSEDSILAVSQWGQSIMDNLKSYVEFASSDLKTSIELSLDPMLLVSIGDDQTIKSFILSEL